MSGVNNFSGEGQGKINHVIVAEEKIHAISENVECETPTFELLEYRILYGNYKWLSSSIAIF